MFHFDVQLQEYCALLTDNYEFRILTMAGVAMSNYLVVLFFAIIPVLMWTNEKQYAKAATYIGFIFVLSFICTLLKYIIRQPMPNDFLIGYLLPDEKYSFPSSRIATATFAYIGAAMSINIRSSPIITHYAIVMSVYIGICRVMLSFNFASDIIVGWLTAVLFLIAYYYVFKLVEYIYPPRRRRGTDNPITALSNQDKSPEIDLHGPIWPSNNP